MCIYMLVTHDEYELPLAVADSAAELARILGVNKNCILSSISHAKKKGHKSQYVKVEYGQKESKNCNRNY